MRERLQDAQAALEAAVARLSSLPVPQLAAELLEQLCPGAPGPVPAWSPRRS